MFVHPANVIPLPASAPPLARTFALIVQGLRQAIADRACRAQPAQAARLMLLWSAVARLASWFAVLATRAAQGRAGPRRRAARPATPHPAPADTRAASPTKPRARLPETHTWLFRLVPEAASFGSQFAHLLNQPEMAAFLEAAPQARGKLRALCRRLGVPWQNVATLDVRPRPRVRPSGKSLAQREPPSPEAVAEVAARRRALRRFARPRREATPPALPAAKTGAESRPTQAALLAQLPEALRPRQAMPRAAPAPGDYPRLGWASLFMLRDEV